ncbi:aspartyl-phosphate phosphatase Spo0E family protein [Bacillus sp. 1P10SD]|uniref:Spo0E family sporulation regulatory protein-aspartic acid phosphatase n=1 Tax=Bacillus sp. 1P10SD TaxID=3132265 RepID=UPI0039A74B13
MLVKELTYSELKAAIEVLRKEMIQCGLSNGLTNERTVQISQILDIHIAQYHSLKNQ